MYTKAKPFLLHAISSVHAGSGSEIGLVDLPIQREQHTGFPKIDSASLKGAIRYTIQNGLKSAEEEKQFELVFGSNVNHVDNNDSQSSAIAFSDARVLLFPVKSMRGVFAWVTCPQVLKRFNDEMVLNNAGVDPLPVPEHNSVSSSRLMVSKGQIVLEEYSFNVEENEKAKQLAEVLTSYVQQNLTIDLRDRVVVLDDDNFHEFVRLSTEVNARIKINPETGVVDAEKGGLWYEENVPPETIFYSFLYVGKVRGNGIEGMRTEEDVEGFLVDDSRFPSVFQLGGNSTLGRGMLRKIWI